MYILCNYYNNNILEKNENVYSKIGHHFSYNQIISMTVRLILLLLSINNHISFSWKLFLEWILIINVTATFKKIIKSPRLPDFWELDIFKARSFIILDLWYHIWDFIFTQTSNIDFWSIIITMDTFGVSKFVWKGIFHLLKWSWSSGAFSFICYFHTIARPI